MLAAAALPCSHASEASSATTHAVTIENLQFNPSSITVRVGDTIVWTNKDLVPHTVTALNKSFKSLAIDPNGGTWTYKADKAGTFDYVCSFHPNMKATLVVQQ